ncbi:uncharacterized protein LOC133364399 [Rhineura floridana]|uniref:uncharacterized protein LOC133364399 n=1 Tax=Rhineura floridana TaxID=261503 RepID=UPI002AC88E0B|nr:uncharacterized protein LOC133364399 [Rhineura floridana]
MGRTHTSTNFFGFKPMLGTILCFAFLCMVYVYFSASFPAQETRVCSRQRRALQEKRENVFVKLAQEVAEGFNLSNCWVCGNPRGFPQWPWMAIPLNPKWLLSNLSKVHNGTGVWGTSYWWYLNWISTGQYCISQNSTKAMHWLGNSKCNWTLQYATRYYPGPGETITPCALWSNGTHVVLKNGTWAPCIRMKKDGTNDSYSCRTHWNNLTQEGQLCAWFKSSKNQSLNRKEWVWHHLNGTVVSGFQNYWAVINHTKPGCVCKWKNETGLWRCMVTQGGASLSPLGNGSYYIPYQINKSMFNREALPALKGHYWICGSIAYSILPINWTGTCYIGIIQPQYAIKGGGLNPLIPVFYEEQSVKRKWAIDTSLTKGQGNGWGDTWPLERIIATYDPASWAHDGSAGYRGPIYIFNRLIRLQAVLEIITNQTAKALTLLADQSTQMREAILQNRLALDYLLAKEGGVCGLLNLTECCLKIDDNGEVVKEIATKIKVLTHAPVQTWKGINLGSWGSWFNWLGGMKTMIVLVVLILLGCMLLPCLLPIIMNGIRSIIDNAVTKSSMQMYGKIMYQKVIQNEEAI